MPTWSADWGTQGAGEGSVGSGQQLMRLFPQSAALCVSSRKFLTHPHCSWRQSLQCLLQPRHIPHLMVALRW